MFVSLYFYNSQNSLFRTSTLLLVIFCCRVEGNYLYGVFDGHDGSKVSKFAAQRMPAELLLGQLSGKTTDDDIKNVLIEVMILDLNQHTIWNEYLHY